MESLTRPRKDNRLNIKVSDKVEVEMSFIFHAGNVKWEVKLRGM